MTRPLPTTHTARPQRQMAVELILRETFGGRFEDMDYTIGVYQRHNDAVQRSIPPERLLVYEVSEGWEPLCEFLGVAAPSEPFPHVNTSASWGGRPCPSQEDSCSRPL